MIEFKNFSKQYDSKLALDNLNLTINDGEIFGLIGHNGAGKSTAIKALTSIIERLRLSNANLESYCFETFLNSIINVFPPTKIKYFNYNSYKD